VLYKFRACGALRLTSQTEPLNSDQVAKEDEAPRYGPCCRGAREDQHNGNQGAHNATSLQFRYDHYRRYAAPDEPGPRNNYNDFSVGHLTRILLISFMDFCDSGNYQEIIRGEGNGDLDTALLPRLRPPHYEEEEEALSGPRHRYKGAIHQELEEH
jgi:hypothetical protein